MSADEKLWIEAEKRIASSFDPEDLRTSGILSARKGRWNAALIRLSEAAGNGLRDMQVMDALGEASYRCKTPQALLAYPAEYHDPLIATHMARALMDLGDFQGAEYYLNAAQPSALKAALHAMLGFKDNIESAMEAMFAPVDAALKSDNPAFLSLDYPAYWHALAPLADVAGREDLLAIAEERSKALDYQNFSVHYNQALRFLERGELRAGWPLYDWGILGGLASATGISFAQVPMWQGEALKGKQLLIVLQHGLGDQIFSLRFVQEALSRFPETTIEIAVGHELFDLVAESFPQCRLHRLPAAGTSAYWSQIRSDIDFWSFAFSLPSRMQLWSTVQTAGYLSAPASLVKIYAEKIRDERGGRSLPVLGLNWHGDMASHAMRTRSYSIQEFVDQSAILNSPALLINLQKTATVEEVEFLRAKTQARGGLFIDAAPTLNDFSHTAAWIKNLDHLYTCDTSVAHLGGALAHPTTALIRNRKVWHWQKRAGSEQATWYDSATIQHALTPKFSYMFDLRMSENT